MIMTSDQAKKLLQDKSAEMGKIFSETVRSMHLLTGKARQIIEDNVQASDAQSLDDMIGGL